MAGSTEPWHREGTRRGSPWDIGMVNMPTNSHALGQKGVDWGAKCWEHCTSWKSTGCRLLGTVHQLSESLGADCWEQGSFQAPG